MQPSVVPAAQGSVDPGFVRLQAPGTLDPNHIDGIGSLSLIAHLPMRSSASPGYLDLRDAEIDIVVRGTDFDPNGARIVFWVCSILPNGQTYNYPVGAQITNWANTGGDFASEITDEWRTITVKLDDDAADWTEAGNYQSIQGDWGARYQPMDLGTALARVDATLHLVAISDSPDDRPTGFLDLASITIRTMQPAAPNGVAPTDAVAYGDEDTIALGSVAAPGDLADGVTFALIAGSEQHGAVAIDPLTGAFAFTPEADFFGPDARMGSATFQFVRIVAGVASEPLDALVYITPRNDAPVTAALNEDLVIASDAPVEYTLFSGRDADDDGLSFDVVAGSVEHGALLLDAATGRYTFTPDADYTGSASFAYVVSDGQATSTAKVVSFTVVDDAPPLPRFVDVIEAYLDTDMDAFVRYTVLLALAGDANAAYHYGTWLASGVHVTRDTASAAQFLRQGLGATSDAALQLAQLYISGDGVARDYGEARTLLASAAADAGAIFRLGMLDYLGLGAPKDVAAAVTGFITAAKMGHAEAMATLGRRYLSGEGVAAQPEDAYFWIAAAIQSPGSSVHAGLRDLLRANLQEAAAQLSPERVAELDAAVLAWAPGLPTLVNDAPVFGAGDETVAGTMGAAITGTLLPGTDADGDRLAFVLVDATEANGTVAIDPKTGAFTYTPAADFFGDASFTYALSDGQAASDAKRVTITVARDTVARDDDLSLAEGASVTLTSGDGVLGNDVSRDNSALTVVAVAGAAASVGVPIVTAYGTLTLEADGSFTYDADRAGVLTVEQEGVDAITYDVVDGLGNRASATLVIRVAGVGGTVIDGSGVLVGTHWADSISGGFGADYLIGGDGDDVLSGGLDAPNALQGGKGDDTYIVLVADDSLIEFADEGVDTVETSLATNMLSANVENLVGTSPDSQSLIGNELANVITASTGADSLDGGAGADTMAGGAGDDVYLVDDPGDAVVEADGEGFDEVRTAIAVYELGASVERLTGLSAAGQTLVGNAIANRIDAGAGDDRLVGGTGNDRLDGGAGIDTADFSAAVSGAWVDLHNGMAQDGDGGVDALFGIENAIGTADADTMIGDDGANRFDGGGGRDYLIGGDGDDVLAGGSGTPNELQGGLGDDWYIVQAESDSLIEFAGEGIDTVETALDRYTLRIDLENLTGTSATGQTLTGNAVANAIFGGSGGDVLDGLDGDDRLDGGDGDDRLIGGAGDNWLIGGAGSDTADYAAASAGVYVNMLTGRVENDAGGVDMLVAVEDTRGTARADTIIGNTADNRLWGGDGGDYLIGGDGADVLDGGAGAANALQGGRGDDVYIISAVGDSVIEFADEGIDTVRTDAAHHILSDNVENLVGLATTGQTLIGNAGANTIEGGGGGDVIDGGWGADTLTGGAGADRFHFNEPFGNGDVDTITDFRPGEDRIVLSAALFGELAGQPLDDAAFAFSASAGDADDRIVYDAVVGQLYYDADGSGDLAAVAIARLQTGLTLAASDFVLG